MFNNNKYLISCRKKYVRQSLDAELKTVHTDLLREILKQKRFVKHFFSVRFLQWFIQLSQYTTFEKNYQLLTILYTNTNRECILSESKMVKH